MTPRRLITRTTVLACVAALSVAAAGAPVASANRSMDSTFQDDDHLVYAAPAAAAHTLDIMKSLGAKRIRVSVFWKLVAPDSKSPTKPAGFNAADPSAYPPGAWDRYDTILRLAAARNIKVNFDVTSPAPNWATGDPADVKNDDTFDPSAKEYGLFMVALGRRYSGTYVPPGSTGGAVPRVAYWSIWNEPNQGGWLTPQWAKDPRSAGMVETSPRIYRDLVDNAWAALQGTGHANDVILVGETAPKGRKTAMGVTTAMDALRFVRQLYCLDDNLQLYQGTSAQLRGCPIGEGAQQKFVTEHPGLFHSSGWSHHPYELTFSPHTKPNWKDWATIANLPALSKVLRRAYQRYGQTSGKNRDVPLYLTEFGYQTNPPDPLAVSPSKQAAWINESEFIAYSNKSVRTLSQFLLYDAPPVPGIPTTSDAAWSTFQTGLLNLNGSHKLSYDSYRFPIYLPKSTASKKGKLRVWGIPRMAGGDLVRTVRVEARSKGAKTYKKVGQLKTDGDRGYVDGNVKVKRSGTIRLVWKDPASGTTYRSRSVKFAR